MYTFDTAPAPYAQTGDVLTLAGGGGLDNLAQSLTMGDTLIFGTNLVNSLRVAFNRTSINRGSPAFFDPLDLGVRNFHTYRDGEMVLAVTGGFNISAATSTTGIFWTNSYQVTDDVTMVRGRHQLGLRREHRVLEVVADVARAVGRQLHVQRADDRPRAGRPDWWARSAASSTACRTCSSWTWTTSGSTRRTRGG